MNILPTLKSEHILEGPFMEIGFNKENISHKVLEYIKSEAIKPIDFVLYNKFNKGNKRFAIDFQTIGANYHGVKTTIINSIDGNTIKKIISDTEPSVIFFKPKTASAIESTLKDILPCSKKGTVVIIDTVESSNIQEVVKFCENNFLEFSLGNEANYTYIIKGNIAKVDRKVKTPLPLAQQVTNKVKREKSPNLT